MRDSGLTAGRDDGIVAGGVQPANATPMSANGRPVLRFFYPLLVTIETKHRIAFRTLEQEPATSDPYQCYWKVGPM